MTSSEDEFVKRELQKTGFQLEDKVASVFSKLLAGCEVEPNYYFTDWQTEDYRELDLRVFYEVTSYPINIEYVFLVECKRLPGHAWAFLETGRQPFIFKQALSAWDNIETIGRQEPVSRILEPLFKVDSIVCDLYSRRFKEIILDAKKSNKKDNNINAATIELAKAMYQEQKSNKWILKTLMQTFKHALDRIVIFYPLIVFEGSMYGAKMFPDIDLKRITSAHLRHSSLQNKEEMEMIIDVIDAQHLRNFIEEKFMAEVNEIRKKEAELRSSYVSLIEKLMSSQKRYTGP